MPRDGSSIYALPANVLAVSGDAISSTKFNSLVQDLESDANVDRPIAAGGTGASTAQAALTNLFSGATPGGADKIGGWDESASAFAFFSLGSGLSFSGTTIGLDADLVTLAGLSPVENNFIVGNSGGTAWEVKTPEQARTAIGLPIGTSGATVPLLNANNTWSGAQTFANGGIIINGTGGTIRQQIIQSGFVNRWAVGTDAGAESGSNAGSNYVISRSNDAGTFIDIPLQINRNTGQVVLSTTPSVAGSTMWHAGNDGAGSGLDADTLDGLQASAFGTLAGSNVWASPQSFPNSSLMTGSAGTNRQWLLQTSSVNRWSYGLDTSDNYILARFNSSGSFQELAVSFSESTGVATFSDVPFFGSTKAARVTSGSATNTGLISWGTGAPGTLAEGEIYLRHA